MTTNTEKTAQQIIESYELHPKIWEDFQQIIHFPIHKFSSPPPPFFCYFIKNKSIFYLYVKMESHSIL